jgi:hypothetical protein
VFCQVYRINNSSSVWFEWGGVRQVRLWLRQVCISLHPSVIRLPQTASVSASVTCRLSLRAGLSYRAQSSDHKYLFVSVTCSRPVSVSWCPVILNPRIASLQSSILFSFVCCCTESLGADSPIKFFGWTTFFRLDCVYILVSKPWWRRRSRTPKRPLAWTTWRGFKCRHSFKA